MNALLVLSLLGCSQIQDLLGMAEPDAAPTAPVAAPVAPPKPKATALQAGKYAEALPELEKALAANPADDAAWDAVELAAVRGELGASLLDRLSADQAIGGRVDRHQALRAELALRAGRVSDALTAATALSAVNAGDGAALVVRAIQAGAAKPAALPPATEALLAAATDPKAVIGADAVALAGGRAALLRAELLQARGDVAGALGALAAVPPAGVLGWRAAMARVAWETDAARGLTATTDAVAAASAAGDLLGAALVLDAGRGHAYAQWKPQAMVDAAAAGRKSAEDAGNAVAAAAFASVQADALLHLGSASDAHAAAVVAAAEPLVAAGHWRLALSCAMLGDAAGVTAAAAGVAEAQAAAIRDLASAMRGGKAELPSAGLTGDDAAWQALLGGGWQADTAGAAARAAAAARAPDLKLWGQLWANRGVVAEAPATPAMQAENAVRGFLSTGTAGTVAGGHPFAAHWNTVLTHGIPAAADADVAALARLINAIDGGFADQAGAEMNDLSAVVPDWRSGPMAPVLALDGPISAEVERLAASPSRLTDEDALALRATFQSWRQRDADRARLWSHGVTPFAPGIATPERVAAVWNAVARQRAGALAWLGGGAYPTASAGEIDNAAVELKLLPRKAGTLAEIRANLGHSALLSYVPSGAGGWNALYLTDHGAAWFHVDPKVARDVEEYTASIRAGRAAVGVGDRVRRSLLDAHADVLTGYGNYYIVGADPLGALPVDALPEQSEGLRYLAAIRHTFYYPNFAAITPPTFQENDFTTTMLAVAGSPSAVESIRRMFPDAVVLSGAAATREAWMKEAPRARFLHFEGLPATASGGFHLPSGESLEAADIAATPLVARTVVVSAVADTAETLVRMSAFRAAGAGDFFTTGVGSRADFNSRMTERFWDATNKRLPVWKAVGEPRMQVAREIDPKGETLPGLWGGVLSAGRLQ